jgi:heat shock protein HslJ
MKAKLIVVPMLILAGVAAGVGLAGCAGDKADKAPDADGAVGAPAAPAPAPLPAGRTFVSTAVTAAGQPKPLVTGTRIDLRIGSENMITVRAGCNSVSGQARLEGTKLVAPDLAIGAMGCPQNLAEQDNWIYGFFRGSPTWQLTGNDLVLSNNELEMKLTDQAVAEPARPLLGTAWKLDTVVDPGGSASSVPTGVTATISFSNDGKVSGRTGCNTFGGTATVAGNQVTFSDLVSTRRACSGPAGSLEADLMHVMTGTATFRIEADRLIIEAPDGSAVQFVG